MKNGKPVLKKRNRAYVRKVVAPAAKKVERPWLARAAKLGGLARAKALSARKRKAIARKGGIAARGKTGRKFGMTGLKWGKSSKTSHMSF